MATTGNRLRGDACERDWIWEREIEAAPWEETRRLSVANWERQYRRIRESSPFYARYLGALSENGAPLARGVGEHLDLDRFRARGIQFLLRFKTRRTA